MDYTNSTSVDRGPEQSRAAQFWRSAFSKVLSTSEEETSNQLPGRQLKNNNKPQPQKTGKAAEYEERYEELTKLKKIIEILTGEYEESKNQELFKRYQSLKGMIKRTVMYTKLDVLPDVSTGSVGVGQLMIMTAGVRPKANQSRIPECPKSELSSRIHLLNKRVSFIRGQIDQLGESYENSKQFIAFQRYRLMKAAIKQLLVNSIDLQYNQ